LTLFNLLVYLISGFRWSFFDIADVNVEVSVAMTLLFLAICMTTSGGSSRPGIG
jgi:ABC-2 type transport system permease protein